MKRLEVSLWIYFSVMQFKTGDDAHRSITLLAFEGGGFPPLSFLVTANGAVSLYDAPCY